MSDPRPARHPGAPGNRWELVWSHRDELLEMARSRSSSAEEAEDAVQEAMVRAVEQPGVPYGRIRSWLRLATVRACADRHRQVARDRELSETLSAAPAEPLLVEEDACDRAEARWLADRSTELLPARQARALRLQAQDLDVGQVARTMGLSYRATESLLARARRSLRDLLAASLTLAAACWMCVRRLPRTVPGQSAGAASAAATLALAGAVLPAAPFGGQHHRPPAHRQEAAPLAAPAAELSSRAAPERPRAAAPSPDPRRGGPTHRDTARSVPGGPPHAEGPASAVALEPVIGSLPPLPLPSAVTTPVPVRGLPVEAPEIPREPPSVPPVGASVESGAAAGLTGASGTVRLSVGSGPSGVTGASRGAVGAAPKSPSPSGG